MLLTEFFKKFEITIENSGVAIVIAHVIELLNN